MAARSNSKSPARRRNGVVGDVGNALIGGWVAPYAAIAKGTELAASKASSKKKRASSKRRKNSAGGAAEVFEEFHGRPSEHIVEVRELVHVHRNLAELGTLRLLVVDAVDGRGKVSVSKFGGAVLCCNESRDQLFVRGGDQSVKLADFGVRSAHEVETLGKVRTIDYFTDKLHLGDEGGRAVYRHKFRTTNQDGKHVTVRIARCPDLIYRTRDKFLEFSGGSYEIRAEGVDK